MKKEKIMVGMLCEKGSSNLMQKDLSTQKGKFPIYGASGLIGYVDFYKQQKEYIGIVKDGAGVGRVMILPPYSSIIGTMQYIIPNANVSVHFLYYALVYLNLGKYCTGATIPHIYFKDYKNELLPQYSFAEQLDIARKLDTIQQLIGKRHLQLQKFDNLVKSQFIEMFEKNEFATMPFGDVCEFVRNGANIKQTKGAGGYPITRIETLANDAFNIDRLGYADIMDIEKYRNYILHNGDILISHINSVAYLGRAVQYKGELETPIIHGMNLLCARLKRIVLPDYIEMVFRMKKAKMYISTITKKAVNQASITTTDLKKMNVSVPPIELQNEFARFVEQTDKSKVLMKCLQILCDIYFKSMLYIRMVEKDRRLCYNISTDIVR